MGLLISKHNATSVHSIISNDGIVLCFTCFRLNSQPFNCSVLSKFDYWAPVAHTNVINVNINHNRFISKLMDMWYE